MSAPSTWNEEKCPVRIEYSPEIFDRIRREALDGLMALPRVGMGIGGFLLGTFENGKAAVFDSLVIPCAHAQGPSFSLTPAEIEEAIALGSGASPLRVVGWYCSKTRGPAELSDPYLAIFNRFCTEPWQFLLFIRPSTVEPTRAMLCFRDAAGQVVRGSEREIEPLAPAASAAPDESDETFSEPAPAAPLPARKEEVPAPVTAPASEQSRPRMIPAQRVPPAVPADAAPQTAAPAAKPAPEPPPAKPAPEPPPVVKPAPEPPAVKPKDPARPALQSVNPPPPAPAQMPPPRPIFTPRAGSSLFVEPEPPPRSWPRLAAAAAILVLVFATIAWFTRDTWLPRPALRLEIADNKGHVTLRWNPEATRGVDGASLLITDNGKLHTFELAPVLLDRGIMSYDRTSHRITATLKIGEARAIAEFEEPDPPASGAPAAAPPPPTPAARGR